MRLSVKLNGELWEAEEFNIEEVAATSTRDACLLIKTGNVPNLTNLYLYAYGVTSPGEYHFDQTNNLRRENSSLDITDAKTQRLAFFGDGPVTIKFTTAENGHYIGTFSGNFQDRFSKKTVTVSEGKFDVKLGI